MSHDQINVGDWEISSCGHYQGNFTATEGCLADQSYTNSFGAEADAPGCLWSTRTSIDSGYSDVVRELLELNRLICQIIDVQMEHEAEEEEKATAEG